MSYNGYLCSVNGVKLPNPHGITHSIIKDGSYSCTHELREIDKWTDDTGEVHTSYFPEKKIVIKFTLRQRTQDEHDRILPIFVNLGNSVVTYYDDLYKSYETGHFTIHAPEISVAYADEDGIYYNELPVTLEEH